MAATTRRLSPLPLGERRYDSYGYYIGTAQVCRVLTNRQSFATGAHAPRLPLASVSQGPPGWFAIRVGSFLGLTLRIFRGNGLPYETFVGLDGPAKPF